VIFMWEKAIGLMLGIVLVFSVMATVNAQGIGDSINPDDPIVGTYALYTKSTRTDLSISSGQASALAIFNGYNGITTKVTITMTLQKQGFLGLWWTDEASWTETFNNYNATMDRKATVSGGTYRVKAVYTAYGGSASETFTEYSLNVKY